MNRSKTSVLCTALCAMALLATPTLGDTINDWASGLQSWRFDFGGSGATLSQDPSEGSPDNAMGALRLDMPFAENTFAFTGDLFFPGMDLSGNTELLFDIKVADGSALDAFGNHGYMQFVSRETDGYTWGNQAGANLPAVSGWQTYSVATANMTATRALTFQLYGGPSQNINGNVTVWLDNVRTVPEPTSGLLACGALGLLLGRRRLGW